MQVEIWYLTAAADVEKYLRVRSADNGVLFNIPPRNKWMIHEVKPKKIYVDLISPYNRPETTYLFVTGVYEIYH
jgi:hypothetical protein